jgi:hypothetical protein
MFREVRPSGFAQAGRQEIYRVAERNHPSRLAWTCFHLAAEQAIYPARNCHLLVAQIIVKKKHQNDDTAIAVPVLRWIKPPAAVR